jgi:Crinkler effector protein N-terminal domain
MSSVKLNCLVWPIENPKQQIVEVQIDSDEIVAFLKGEVKRKYPRKLDKVDTSDLVLWKCSITIEDSLEENLESIRFGTDTRLDHLTAISQISEYFPTSLPDGTVNILIELPSYSGCNACTPLFCAESFYIGSDDYRPSKRRRTFEKLTPSHPLHKLWLLRQQSDTKSFIFQHKMEDIHTRPVPSSTYWVMTQKDEINSLLGFGQEYGLKGVLIREEYKEAFRAAIEFAETGEANCLTEAAADDESELHQNEAEVQDSYLNPFSDISDTRSRQGGFILIGHPGIGEYHSLSPKIQTFSLLFQEKRCGSL